MPETGSTEPEQSSKPSVLDTFGPPVFLFGLAIALRISSFSRSLTADEVYSLQTARLPLGQAWTADVSPGLFYVLLKAWIRVSESDFWVGLLSALLAGITVVATYGIARLVGSRKTAFLSALFLCCSYNYLVFSGLLRSYGLMAACSALALFAFFTALKDGRNKPLIWLIIFSSAALYANFLGILLIFSLNIFFLAVYLGGYRKLRLGAWLVSQIILAITQIPNAFFVHRIAQGADNYAAGMSSVAWGIYQTPRLIFKVLVLQLSPLSVLDGALGGIKPMALALALSLPVLWLLGRELYRKRKSLDFSVVWLFGVLVIPLIALSFHLGLHRFFQVPFSVKYLILLAPPICLAYGHGLYRLRYWGWLLALPFLVVGPYLADREIRYEDWKGPVDLLVRQSVTRIYSANRHKSFIEYNHRARPEGPPLKIVHCPTSFREIEPQRWYCTKEDIPALKRSLAEETQVWTLRYQWNAFRFDQPFGHEHLLTALRQSGFLEQNSWTYKGDIVLTSWRKFLINQDTFTTAPAAVSPAAQPANRP